MSEQVAEHPAMKAFREATHSYVAVCHKCGEQNAAQLVVKGREKATAAFVAQIVKGGDEARLVPSKEVTMRCMCYSPKPAEPTLFAENA